MCNPCGTQHMLILPEFFIPKYFIFKPIVQQIEINFRNVFHWGIKYFACAFIDPNGIIGETKVYV